MTTTTEPEEKKTISTKRTRSNARSRVTSTVVEQPTPRPPPIPTFLTEDLTLPSVVSREEATNIPFYEALQIPSNLVQSMVFQYVD